jgi:hypothetical protein
VLIACTLSALILSFTLLIVTMLSGIILSPVVLIASMLSALKQSFSMLSVVIFSDITMIVFMLSFLMLSFVILSGACRSADCFYANVIMTNVRAPCATNAQTSSNSRVLNSVHSSVFIVTPIGLKLRVVFTLWRKSL